MRLKSVNMEIPWELIINYIVWILLGGVCFYFYFNVKKQYSYWKRRGVKQVKPRFFFGNVAIFRKKAQVLMVEELYKAFPEERYHGIYQFLQPTLIIKDIELIKRISIKDFDYFKNRRTFVSADIDPFWSKTLFASEGDRWHDLRTTLSPSFTSNKLKILYTVIDECIQQFIDYFKNDPSDIIELEMKDTLSRFTNDVIASAAFGLKCDSLKDRENPFYFMGKQMTNFGGVRMMKFFMDDISPTLNQLLRIRLIPANVATYFSKIITETVQIRKEQNIVRQDMINILMTSQKGRQRQSRDHDSSIDESFASSTQFLSHRSKRKRKITLEDIISQAFIFFFAGFETASTFLVFAFYELAVNPDVQKKIFEEIDLIEGKVTQEDFTNMRYFDQTVCEILRKWPPVTVVDRKVTKPYTIQPSRPEEKALYLDEGVICWLPIFAIHRDDRYFKNPEKFDPERFNEENKVKSSKAYLPFGTGPRSCLGTRFALLEGKLLIFYVLKNFEVVPISKTQIPVILDTHQPNITPKDGLWLGLKKRF